MTTKNQDTSQPPALAFIDAIEEGVARVLVRDAAGHIQTGHMPAALLPADAREGKWIEVRVRTVPAPAGEDPSALRRKLGEADPGGDIVL